MVYKYYRPRPKGETQSGENYKAGFFYIQMCTGGIEWLSAHLTVLNNDLAPANPLSYVPPQA